MHPNFLIVQFPEGGAGVFLISLLAASESVGHPEPDVAANKNNQTCIDFIRSRYTDDVSKWLLNEPRPQTPLNLHFISTKFARGEELSQEQFFNLCVSDASDHFWNIVNSGRLVPLIWHKKNIANFLVSPRIVTVLLDPPSYKWYHRALWYKKYGIKDQQIHIKSDDPLYNPSRAKYFNQYNNPYLIDQHPISFIKQNILKTKVKETFGSPDNFVDPHRRVFIKLSEMLNLELFVPAVDRICTQLNLAPISESVVVDAWQHWKGCHDSFMPKYS